MTAPALVYLFCFVTCAACALLLVRSWQKTRTRLLMWVAMSFVLLAANNFFLFADVILLPSEDLSVFRTGAAIAAVSVLIFGLVWEAD
jgi:Family of unknown function (DUF5985)